MRDNMLGSSSGHSALVINAITPMALPRRCAASLGLAVRCPTNL